MYFYFVSRFILSLHIVAGDFVALQPLTIENSAEIRLFPNDDDITLEYNDTIILKFTADAATLGIIRFLENQPTPEFVRETATANIIDDDGMHFLYDNEQCRCILFCYSPTNQFQCSRLQYS